MNTKFRTTFGLLAALSIFVVVLTACSPASPVSAAAVERFGQPGGRGGQGAGNGAAPQDDTQSNQGWQGRGTMGQGLNNTTAPQTGTGYALTPLTDAEKDALVKAVNEEYGALTLYNSIITQYGSVYPFNMIARAEQQHINALLRQIEKYGVTAPIQPAPSAASTYATLADACAAGAVAEIKDAALYDTLKSVTQRADLLQVFNSLQSASLNSHLPAFEACK